MSEQWFSVKESLPRPDIHVLAYGDYAFYVAALDEFSRISETGARVWRIGGSDDSRDDITHWMPLPEQPRYE